MFKYCKYKYSTLIISCLLTIIISAFVVDKKPNNFSLNSTNRIFTEYSQADILPRVELLSGVLSHTSWINRRGPKGVGNKYYNELHNFLLPFKDHTAIILAEKMISDGFTYDAPINFILSLSDLPYLDIKYPYNNYLISRSGGIDQLNQFRSALVELSKISEFITFFNSHKQEYNSWIYNTISSLNIYNQVDWFENFFGWKLSKFHIILAPAMFPGGGYSAHYPDKDKKTISYQVIREYGASETIPFFGTKDNIEKVSLHELGHSFVNPSLELHKSTVDDYKLIYFYSIIEKQMEKHAYKNLMAFLNESILRAIIAINYSEQNNSNKELKEWNKKQISKGFYLQEVIIKSLLYYQNNRNTYLTFKDFVPVLLNDIAKSRKFVKSMIK